MNTYEYINSKYLTVTGKLNARKSAEMADDTLLYEMLKKETDFLPNSVSLGERIYCLFHKISELPTCEFCGNKKSYVEFRGYKETCGYTGCGMKLRYRNIENRKKTGENVKNHNAKMFNLFLTKLQTLDSLYIEPPKLEILKSEKMFINEKSINKMLWILKESKKYLPIEEKTKQEFQNNVNLRILLIKNGSKKICEKCGDEHIRIKNSKFEELCQKCNDERISFRHREKVIGRAIDRAEDNKVELIKFSGKLTQQSQMKCEHGHIFKRKLSSDYVYNGFACPTCNNLGSRLESRIQQFINELDPSIELILNSRQIISPYELDIYIPKLKVAIELNGDYWHSFNRNESDEEKNYHLNKTLLCKKNDIKLIHIFENEINYKEDIIKSKLKSVLGINNKIYARKCKIQEIDTEIKNAFLNENHLQGVDASTVKLGLFYNDELVSVMTFGKPRFNRNYEWELLRFANKLNYNVVGGAGKLLSYFEKKYSPKSIISYADMRWSTGNLYEKIGFKFSHYSTPNYWYIKGDNKLSRMKCQKHKLSKLLGVTFDESKSESENMFNNGWRRIWDCGNLVFTKIIS